MACDCRDLNSCTVGDAYLMPTIDEVLRKIDKKHIMGSANTLNPICCHVSKMENVCVDRIVFIMCTII